MDNSKLIAGFLLGAAVGATIGILLAPDKGTATRKKIIDKGADMSDAIKGKFNEVVDGVKGSFTKAKEDARNAMS